MKKPLHLEDLAAALNAKPQPAELSEAEYKQRLVAQVNVLPHGYAQRIEDKFMVGALDMLIKLPGLPIVFAEGKLIKGNLFNPTPLQFAKGERMTDAGLTVLLIGWQAGTMYVSKWARIAEKGRCFSWPAPNYTLGLTAYLTR